MSTPTYYLRRYCLPVCALTLAACHKLVTAPPPQDEMSIAAVFSNDDDAAAAMQGYYNIAMNNQRGPVNGAIGLDAALSADELICTTPPAADDSFQVYNLSATTPQNTESFDILYKLILQINTMLLGLRSSSGMSAPAKAQMEGEALFNRAFVYFYLANLYGSVPLVLTTDYLMNSALPGAPTDSIYAQMTADLEQAIQLLPASYTEGTGVNIGHRVHPDRSAAQALLARVLLYRKQWAAAETSATTVIEDPGYTLEPNPDSVFLSTSREAIWQLRPFYGATAEAIAYGKRPSFALTPQLAGSLETGDLRARWIDSTLYQGHVILYPYKYRLITDTGAVMEYETVLRLSEQYLIRAEARAQLGELAGAIADVNVIRARAGLSPTPAITQEEILNAIFRERRIEFFCEWGHRWLDLKRTGQADTTLYTKKGWDRHDLLYPIPVTELLADPNLRQNPGY